MSDEPEVGEGRAVPSASDNPDDAVVSDSTTAPESAPESEVDLVKSERDSGSLDEASEDESSGSVRESALVGAAAGSARAAARRSGARAGSTPAKGTATRPRDTGREVKVNVFARLGRFLREVVAELRKVIWPARNQMVTYTIVVIVFVVFMVALTAGLDVLFAKGVLAVFG
ncbi:preprotein translocase subunit SecE [Nakamurella sp. PAMC28650]|uniref:preprotein translocase subunit SecE n=1 Tax=Nakamurella sp. PAMC28650 TaxID=2762325 RepID=UPI00210509D2|nr:preprotein translocase subunit SecE [Nakamurella sp. PAMC28650]